MNSLVAARGFPARLSTRLSFLVAGFVMASWAPQVPYAKLRLALDDGAFGLLLLCVGIGSVLAMQITGSVVARFGSRPMVLIGGSGLCLTLPLLALANTEFSLAICLLLFGASLGSIDVAMNVHAVEVEQAVGEPLMSGFHGMFSLGGLAGAAGGTALLASGLGPAAAAGVAAAVAAVLLVLAAPGLLRSRSTATGPLIAIPRGIVILISALAFVAFLTEGAILDWSALLLTGPFHFSTEHGGIGYALFSIAMAIARLTGDRTVKLFGQRSVLLYGGLTVTAGFSLLLLSPIAWIAPAGFLLIGLGAANLVPILFSSAGRQNAMPAALAVASITTLGYAGILVGPAIIGFLASLISLRAAFAVLALIMLGFPLFRARVPLATPRKT